MTLQDVREALRDVIQTQLPEWRVYPNIQAVTQAPCVIIQPSVDVEIPSAKYTAGFGNTTLWYLDLIVLVPYKNMTASTIALDNAVSRDHASGIPGLINLRNSPVLKDTFKTLKVVKMRDYGGRWSATDIDHIGACIKLEAEEQCRSTA